MIFFKVFSECINITYITPELKYTPTANILELSFSHNYGELFNLYKKYSSIKIENFDGGLNGFSYTQLPTYDDFYLTLDFKRSVINEPLLTLDLNLPPQCIFNTSLSVKLTTYVFQIHLQDQYALDQATKNLIVGAKTTTETMNSATSNAFIANNMIPSGASFALRCLISMDAIRFLRFFLIGFPPNVVAMFETNLPTADFIPNVQLEESEEDGVLPEIFQSYEISIYIFNNCGNNLVEIICYLLIGVVILFLMKSLFKETTNRLLKVALIIFKTIFVWNYALSNFLSSFMSYSFYTFLSYRYPAQKTTLGKFNLYFSIFMGFAMLGVLLFVLFIISKIRLFLLEQVFFIFCKSIYIYIFLLK